MRRVFRMCHRPWSVSAPVVLLWFFYANAHFLFSQLLVASLPCYSVASQDANKEDHRWPTVNWLDLRPLSADWQPGRSRGNSSPTTHINAVALQYFMHSAAQCSWCFPFLWLPSCVCNAWAKSDGNVWTILLKTGPNAPGHGRVWRSLALTADLCRCFRCHVIFCRCR